MEFVNYECEMCRKVYIQENICIHRVRRGNEGGTYHFRNCMVVCKECHKKLHANEFRCKS